MNSDEVQVVGSGLGGQVKGTCNLGESLFLGFLKEVLFYFSKNKFSEIFYFSKILFSYLE